MTLSNDAITPAADRPDPSGWPPKQALLGTAFSLTDYAGAVHAICDAAEQARGGAVAATCIFGVMHARRRPDFAECVNAHEMATVDGQGIRWALNLLYGVGMKDRVYGPTLMRHVATAAAGRGLRVYLYGSTEDVVERLKAALLRQNPSLQIVGSHCPPFRPLSAEEDARDVEQIQKSKAQVVFVGLGCPLQDIWMREHRERLDAVLIGVGAAFDFIAGVKRQAPPWVQRCGLEMAFRACTEPRRLFGRFLFNNPPFAVLVVGAWLKQRMRRRGDTPTEATTSISS